MLTNCVYIWDIFEMYWEQYFNHSFIWHFSFIATVPLPLSLLCLFPNLKSTDFDIPGQNAAFDKS